MATEHSGREISLGSDYVFKPEPQISGILLKMHEYGLMMGYTALYSADGTQDADTEIAFGDGVFYNAVEQNNNVYIGQPTAAGASAVFAGIMVYQASIGNSTPIDGDVVKHWQKANICKQGYIEYKKGLDSAGAAYDFTDARVGHDLYIRNSDGKAMFSASDIATATKVGTVVSLNPDGESWTVHVSPSYL